MGGLQALGGEAVAAEAARRRARHERGLGQHAQVLGHLRLAQPRRVHELGHGALAPLVQQPEQVASVRFPDGIEDVPGIGHARPYIFL